jgi:hypothetical protein
MELRKCSEACEKPGSVTGFSAILLYFRILQLFSSARLLWLNLRYFDFPTIIFSAQIFSNAFKKWPYF